MSHRQLIDIWIRFGIFSIEKLGLQITQGLSNLIDEVSGKIELAKKYNNENAFFLEPVHGEDVLEEAIEKLEPMFQRRIRAVEVCSTTFFRPLV